jgi:hypothetical protein
VSDFVPYKPEDTYKCELNHAEATLIQKIRDIGYGSIKVHVVNRKIIRTETTHSELSEDDKGKEITIALEVINN